MHVAMYISLGFGIVSVAAYNIIRVKKLGVIGFTSKMLSSLFFVLVGVFAGQISGAPGYFYGPMLAGMCVGFIGDIFLDLIYIWPKYRTILLVTGIILFGVGHLLYAFAALMSVEQSLFSIFLPIAIVFVLAFFLTFYVAPLVGLDFKQMDFICLGYVFVILYVIGAVLTAAILTGFAAIWLMFLGGIILFTASDTALAFIFFGRKQANDLGYTPTPRAFYMLNHATYHPAQYILALSLLLFIV